MASRHAAHVEGAAGYVAAKNAHVVRRRNSDSWAILRGKQAVGQKTRLRPPRCATGRRLKEDGAKHPEI